MKKTIALVMLLIASCIFYSKAGAVNSPSSDIAVDRDPIEIVKPGNSVIINDKVIKNDGSTDMKIRICPGKGEPCSVSVTAGGVTVKVKEEKDSDKNIIEIEFGWF